MKLKNYNNNGEIKFKKMLQQKLWKIEIELKLNWNLKYEIEFYNGNR